MQVPFVAPDRQLLATRREIDAAIARVIRRCDFADDGAVKDFEHAFARYCDASHCVAVSSAAGALALILRALEVGQGDEVIVPANASQACLAAISAVGAVPVFVDVDGRTYCLDPVRLSEGLSGTTRAIVAGHAYGQCADIPKIRAAAEPTGVPVVEEAFEAHGARLRGRRAGALAAAAAFSFDVSASLGGFGDGGGVVTNDDRIAGRVAEELEALRASGPARLDALRAAVLAAKLPRLDRWIATRRRCAALYGRLLFDAPIRVPIEAEYGTHAWHRYAIRVPNGRRDAIRSALAKSGIETGLPDGAFADSNALRDDDRFPVGNGLACDALMLPIFESMTEREVTRVVAVLRSLPC